MSYATIQDRLLKECLLLAPFDGWNDAMIRHACKNLSISESEYIRTFDHGAPSIISYWIAQADSHMQQYAADHSLTDLKIRQRLKQLILCRLDYFKPHREAYRKAMAHMSLPANIPLKVKLLSQSVDSMWLLAGDQSHDYNWYTKRFLLSLVYTSTLTYWLSQESQATDGDSATSSFLDRRIENVMQAGGFISKILRRPTH